MWLERRAPLRRADRVGGDVRLGDAGACASTVHAIPVHKYGACCGPCTNTVQREPVHKHGALFGPADIYGYHEVSQMHVRWNAAHFVWRYWFHIYGTR